MKTERTTTTTSNGRGPDACTNVQDGRDDMMVPGRKNGSGSRGTRLPSWAVVQMGEHASGSGDHLREIPEKNPGTIPGKISGKFPVKTWQKIPERIPEKIMGKFPVKTSEKILEKIMGKFPVTIREKIPEKIPGKFPVTIKGKIPGGEPHGVPSGIGIMRSPGGGPV